MARRTYAPSGRDVTWGLILLVAGRALQDVFWQAALDAPGRPGGGLAAQAWIGDVVSLVGLVLLVAGVLALAATADPAAGSAAADAHDAADGSTSAGDIRTPGR